MLRRAVLVLTLVLASSCAGDDLRGDIRIVSTLPWSFALRDFAALVPYTGLTVGIPGEPDFTTSADYTIIVVEESTIPAEGFRIADTSEFSIRVQASDVLGAQYGVAAALEAFGFRFRHPFDTLVPLAPRIGPMNSEVQSPDVRRRGFQLHTLHPIESYYAMWEPSPSSYNDAIRIIDWTIKNRGNYVQWVGLDDIITDPERHAAWKEHTKAVLRYAHSRGIKVGINIQLFGESNLQQSFDLVDKPATSMPIATQIAARLPLITTDTRFDVYHVSFGEFFNADNQAFIDALNEVERRLAVLAPGAEMHGLVHVGADQRVMHMGEDLIYYFLVKFASPTIIPDIHSVMFYNLFEDAGGAYHHEQFDEHLAYLRELMCAGRPHSYLPETAYWVAFDNSVPQYLPLYIRSRWLDLARIRSVPGPCGTLDQHILFSSGWEWGYWLHDVASLRASYNLPATPGELIAEQYAPDLGGNVAHLVDQLMTEQREALIHHRLAPYLAGRDSVMDLGRSAGIVSQPDRINPADLVASGDVLGFTTSVMEPLAVYANAVDALGVRLAAFELPASSRWARELRDGFAVDLLRAQFVLANYAATIASIEGNGTEASRQHAIASARLDDARGIVAGRHGDLHDTHGRRLLDKPTGNASNRTIYQYGYLYFADTLCYWQRELDQVGGIIGATSVVPPSCFY